MAAISRITIDGFKAFPDSFTLDLGKGNNLLMYGENGSGKSSIYYALYSLLQSQCKDKNSIYFDINSPESLVNQHTKKADAKVEIQFEGSDVTYNISKNGYQESVAQPVSPLKDLNGKCVFINHKFLFNVFSFRNSQFIDLFPVFIKDILPFTLTRDQSQYISQLYEEIMAGIEQKRKRTAKSYSDKISNFNEELQEVIRKVNESGIPAASELYNKFFRNEDEPELRIKLIYDNNIDHIPQPGKSYWLRLGYRFKDVVIANVHKTERLSHRKELLSPVITLNVEEKQADGTYIAIKKPQTYFNEAKLTAIALAIRFSLLDTISPEDGRFIALDDMLISLDMSNRTKVVDYLLKEVIGKYKIYLFTHDKSLYAFVDYKIKQYKQHNNWLRKELYVGKDSAHKENPIIVDGEIEPIDKAKKYLDARDYEVASLYVRKALEKLIVELLPRELYQKPEGGFVELQTLWKKLVTFYSNNRVSIDPNIIKLFEDSKLLVLNPSAHHQRLATPIYKNELKSAFLLYEELSKLPKIEKKYVIPKGSIAEFNAPHVPYYCRWEFDNDLVVHEGEHLISLMPKCKDIYWRYNGVDYYDFETGVQNINHRLKTASPNLNKLLEGLTQKIPLGITEEQFMENCTINGTKLNDYLGGVKISSLILASTKA